MNRIIRFLAHEWVIDLLFNVVDVLYDIGDCVERFTDILVKELGE